MKTSIFQRTIHGTALIGPAVLALAAAGGCGIALSLDSYTQSGEEAMPSCSDGAKNQNETAVDCGGSCPACADNQGCLVGTDCMSLVCVGNLCRAPTCSDGVKNGDELGVDCRGSCVSQKCLAGDACNANNDCIGGQCTNQVCAPTCNDNAQNGQETGLDCGGAECGACANSEGCALNGDCQSGVCKGEQCIDFHRFSKGFNDVPISSLFSPSVVVGTNTGNRILMGGEFIGDVDFGKGIESTQGATFPKIFLAQFDGNGNCEWSNSYGASNHSQHLRAISSNAGGDIAIAGYHYGDLNLGGGVFTLDAAIPNVYVGVFSALGQHKWSRSFGTVAGNDGANGVAINAAGEVLITGTYEGVVNVGGKSLSSQSGSKDIFLVRYKPDGTALWAKSFGDVEDQSMPVMAENDKGNAALAGTLTGTVDFGGGPLVDDPMLSSIFVAVFNSQGDHLWSRAFSHTLASTSLILSDVVIDDTDHVTVIGWFAKSIQLDSFILQAVDKSDVFAARFDPSGKVLWARSYGNTESDFASSLDTAPDGALILTGKFSNTIDFGGQVLSSMGSSNMFIAKLTPNADLIWSHAFGENGSVGISDIRAQGLEDVVVGVTYSGPLDFGGGALPLPSTFDHFGLAGLRLPAQ